MKFLTALIIALTASHSLAHDHGASVSSTQVSGNIHMLAAEGGNIGVAVGNDSIFIIDDQFEKLAKKNLEAIKAISDKPIEFLLNTHFHFDHSGGNQAFHKHGATIIAHDNVHTRLKDGATIKAFGKVMEPASADALPVLTYPQEVTIHLGNDTATIMHFANAHTDGDSAVFFKDANVIHTGDLYFSGMYPFIDTSNGGSVEGYIAAQQAILDNADEHTKIIPGHGPLSTRATLEGDLTMLKTISARVKAGVDNGQTLDEILAGNPSVGFEESHGQGFLNTEAFVGILFEGLNN